MSRPLLRLTGSALVAFVIFLAIEGGTSSPTGSSSPVPVEGGPHDSLAGGANTPAPGGHPTSRPAKEPPPPPAELPTLSRTDVYRSIAEAHDPETARRIADGLRRALGGEGLSTIERDLEGAIESDAALEISGCAFVLSEAARGPDPELDDERLLGWIDAIAVSDVAAGAIAALFHRARRMAGVHADRTVEVVRRGLGSEPRRIAAARLLLLHAELHRDPARFLRLLHDELAWLRRIAAEALARIDPVAHATAIIEAADRGPDETRTAMVHALLGALPVEVAAERLRALHRRWPQARLTEPWLSIGERDGTVLAEAFRREADPTIRRRMLIGWHPEGLGPRRAERFLTEVLDTDPDRSVRAQALLALGQTDDDLARRVLERTVRDVPAEVAGDRLWAAHLDAALRNALATAPEDWVDRVAIPHARRRIATARDPERVRARWVDALERSFPDRVSEIGLPESGLPESGGDGAVDR